MGNEMGNRNINGLQVSEQESNDTTDVIDHSPNTSFLSLNGLDGLKGVSDYLEDSLMTSEKHETENLAAGDFSEPSLAFDDAEDQSQLNSLRENEEKRDTKLLASNESSTSSLMSNKKPTELASIESLQEDVSDEECDVVNKECAKALTVLNGEDGIEGFPHGLLDCLPEKQGVEKVDADKSLENLAASNQTDDKIHLISATEVHDLPDKLYNSAHLESCKVLIQKQTLDHRGSERNSGNQDSKENTANISSEHSVVSNEVQDSLQSISSTDLHDVHEKPSDPSQSESDESLIRNQIFEERCSEMDSENQDFKENTANISSEHSVVSNEAEDSLQSISSTDLHDVHEKPSDPSQSESDESLIRNQIFEERCSEMDSENQDFKENTANISSEHSVVSNEAEDSLLSISSTDLHDVHEKPSDPAQSESDESLIQNQIFEERCSEMDSENQDSEENTANKSLERSALSNDAEDLTQLFSSTDNLHEKLSDSAGSESDESLIQKQFFEQRENKDAMTWVQGTSGKCHELEDEEVEKGTCGETVFMDSKNFEEGQRHCAESYQSEKCCAASKLEEKRPLELVNAAYLDAIDNEINVLLQTDDLDEVGKQSKSEPNGFQETQDYGKATSEDESQMEDIENDSFDIQLNGINPCAEEKEEREDVGLEEATFELAIQTGYSPILMSEERKEDPVEETNGVEMGNSSTPDADNKGEEKIGCGSNKLETHGIVGEQLSELSIANDTSTEEAVILSMVSENGTKNSGNGDVNEEKEKTKRLNLNAEVESECPNGEVNGHAEVVADELIDQTVAAANTMTPTSPLLFEVAEAVANKEELFTIDTPRDSTWCAQPFDPENDSSATESVKCVTYEYERSTPGAEESTLNYKSKTEEKSKQGPPFSRGMEVSVTDGSIREYRVSTSHEDVGRLSDRSPLLFQRKSEDSRASAEETDSEKPRTPFLNFLKEEVGVKEWVEKEGLLQKKTVKESKKSTTTSSVSKEKQKPRSSLFSSCICCTTAIN